VGGGGHSGGGHSGGGHSGGGQGRVDAGVVPVQHTTTAVANPRGTAAPSAVDPQGTGVLVVVVSPRRAGAVVTDHQADVAVVSVQLGVTAHAVVPVWTVTVADVVVPAAVGVVKRAAVVYVQWAAVVSVLRAAVGAVGDHRKTRGGCSA
jgi:hypothetical protein